MADFAEKFQNWFQRRLFRQMSKDNDSGDGDEYITALAAAAFTFYSLEESGTKNEEKRGEGREKSFTRTKSKQDDTTVAIAETGKLSRLFSGQDSMKSSEGSEMMVPTSAATGGKLPKEAVGAAPPIKKTPSFSDERLSSMGGTQPEYEAPQPDLPSTTQPAFPPTGTTRQSSMRGGEETAADSWEKAEMAKVKERYEKLKSAILSWEDKKKKQAKRRMDRTESELQQRRAKATKRYNSDMEDINRTAGGARAQAEEKRRNKEFKVKEKANIIRSTGKVPTTCFCC